MKRHVSFLAILNPTLFLSKEMPPVLSSSSSFNLWYSLVAKPTVGHAFFDFPKSPTSIGLGNTVHEHTVYHPKSYIRHMCMTLH